MENIYQLKITLKGVKSPIWRLIEVPETYTFEKLHEVIQDAMGWEDYHLYAFEIGGVEIANKDTVAESGCLYAGKEKIKNYFSKGSKAIYTYDFGDDWVHEVKVKDIIPAEKGVKYPRCIDGKRACPPEDCGGIYGYNDFLEAMKDPHNEEHDEVLEWIGGEFDPEKFDPKEVIFRKHSSR